MSEGQKISDELYQPGSSGVCNVFGIKGQKIKINFFTGNNSNIPYFILTKI